ncbi:MOB kinase activator-like 2 [Armadillidium vulgare]|nr:MOB kinase activator-like 2 [Armadillidium vulgare]
MFVSISAIDFFHHINLLYGTICEYCTLTGCPDMTGPGLRQYLWFDEKGKKTRVAAPQYVDYVMTFTQNTVNDESIFPTKFENEFPSSFESIVKKIHRLLFHVLAHLYHAHFREVVLLSLHAHLNCVFAHFVLFNEKFKLVDEKETEILHDLVLALKIHPETDSHSLNRAQDRPIEGKTVEGLSSSVCIPSTTLSEQTSSSGSPANRDGQSYSSEFDVSLETLRREEQLGYSRVDPSTAVTASVTQVSASISPLGESYVNNVTLAEVLP